MARLSCWTRSVAIFARIESESKAIGSQCNMKLKKTALTERTGRGGFRRFADSQPTSAQPAASSGAASRQISANAPPSQAGSTTHATTFSTPAPGRPTSPVAGRSICTPGFSGEALRAWVMNIGVYYISSFQRRRFHRIWLGAFGPVTGGINYTVDGRAEAPVRVQFIGGDIYYYLSGQLRGFMPTN